MTLQSSVARTRRRWKCGSRTSLPRRLYEKYGFRPVGLRPRYYSDDNEDALIMTTEPLGDPHMRERITRLRAALEATPPRRTPNPPKPPKRPLDAADAASPAESSPVEGA